MILPKNPEQSCSGYKPLLVGFQEFSMGALYPSFLPAGLLKRLTTLKVDDNQLTILPNAIGK